MAKRVTVSQLEAHAGYWLRYVSNHVSQGFSRKVEAHGVTVAEWVLLREMFEAGAAHPSQLAEALGMTRGAVSKLVERLCLKKLVKRSVAEGDQRFQVAALTAAGQRIVPVLAALADQNDEEFFGHLSPQDRNRLVRTMQDIVRRQGWKKLPVN